MTDNPYQDTAREFINLWQKQMTSVMGDKQFIHAMLELFQNMQAKPNAKPTATASNTANAPAPEHGVLAELAFRVAMCEKRLAALESKQPATRGTAKRNPRGSKKSNK
jgi:hypothetical protein